MIDEDFPQFVGGTIKVPRGRPASIQMDCIELANKFAEEVPLLMVDADDKEGKEAIAHLTVGVRLNDVARHFSLDEPTTLFPPPGPEPAGQNRKGARKNNWQALHCAWMEVQLDDEEMLMDITTDQVVQAVSDIGLKVTQRSRVIAKVAMDDAEEKTRQQSLGDAFDTHRFNLNVVPRDGSDVKSLRIRTSL